MSETIADRTNKLLGTMTRTERRVGQVLLSQYPLLGLETAMRVAEAAQTTAPTVLRFISKLGFSGYAEFQQALRQELQPRFQSALSRQASRPKDAGDGHYFGRYSEAVVANIRRTNEMLPRQQFDAIVELLADTGRPTICLGGRFSQVLALYIYSFLAEMRPKVELVSGQTATWPTRLLAVGKRHVLIVFDYRRYQPDVIGFAEAAAQQGATIVVFTDEWMSNISRVAHHVVMSPVIVPSLYDSSASALVQIEAIIGRLGQKLGKATQRRIEKLEKARQVIAFK
jgi:DNA-binding MurR/RpiR family transcriptional regulator